jgi:hypothetical protein
VGHLPAVAPVVVVEEKPKATGVIPETLETLRRGLQEAIDKLQDALEQLKRMTP